MARIHTYVSKEPMVKPNAFIVEADAGLVIVDTTLTMSDSQALKQVAERLGKPIAGVLLTQRSQTPGQVRVLADPIVAFRRIRADVE